jgi:hypothetical protein
MMLGNLAALKTWDLLDESLLFELRACPICRRPVLRWRPLDEIREEIFRRSLTAAGGNVSLAARRLKISRRSFYDTASNALRAEIDQRKAARKPAEGVSRAGVAASKAKQAAKRAAASKSGESASAGKAGESGGAT